MNEKNTVAMFLKEGERIDDLGRNGYRIIQDPKKFCFGIDAVLLSWFSSAGPGEKVIDLGSGTGIVPLLMDARYGQGEYTAVEIQPDMADMIRRSVLLNGAEERFHVAEGDLKESSVTFGKGVFDVVTANPPYIAGGAGLVNPNDAKAISRHEIACTLEDVVREASLLLKPGGRFYMIHRPKRLAEIFAEMEKYRLKPARMIMVHPYADKEASMVLLQAVKNGRNELKVEAPLIVYQEKLQYSEAIRKIYEA